MAYYFAFFLYFFTIFSSFAQKNNNKIDSLEKLLATQKDTSQVNIYLLLSLENKLKNPAKSLEYAEKALQNAQKIDFKTGETNALIAIGAAEDLKGNFNKAITLYTQAQTQAQNLTQPILMAMIYNNIGLTYSKSGNYPESLKNYLQALKIYEQSQMQEKEANVLENIAILHQLQQDYDKALAYYNQALSIHQTLDNQKSISKMFVNMGALYTKKKDYEQALEYHFKALQGFEATNDQFGIGIANNNMANVYLYQNLYEKSIEFYTKSLLIKRKNGDQRGISLTLRNLAEAQYKNKQPQEAEKSAIEALTIAQKIKAKEQEQDALMVLSEVYQAQKQYDKALDFYQKYVAAKDTLFNTQKSKQIIQMQTLYETEKKSQENKILKKDNQLKNYFNYAILAVLVVVLLLAFLIFYKLQFRNKEIKLNLENEQIKSQKTILLLENEQFKSQKLELEKQKQQTELDYKNRELTSSALFLVQKNELLSSLQTELTLLLENENTSKDASKNASKNVSKHNLNDISKENSNKQSLKKLQRSVSNGLTQEQDWDTFRLRFGEVHPQFFIDLKAKFAEITPNEEKLCAFLRLNMTTKEIASLTNNSVRGVETSRYRLRKKLNLNEDVNLVEFLEKF